MQSQSRHCVKCEIQYSSHLETCLNLIRILFELEELQHKYEKRTAIVSTRNTKEIGALSFCCS